MNMKRKSAFGAMTMLGIALGAGLSAPTAVGQAPVVVRGATVVAVSTPRFIDVDLRTLPKPKQWEPGDPIKNVPRRRTSIPIDVPKPKAQRDPLLVLQENARTVLPQRAFGTTILNFEGQGFSGVNPPDTNGDVGMNYFVQAINDASGTKYIFYNKFDGSVAAGPFSLDALASGGNCTGGLGDPIVLYDEQADRWLLSEFAGSGNSMCVYVSATADPISGGWFAYQFDTPSFPDYPKYGVWADAYYVGSNEGGGGVYAMDRSSMLIGAAASMQRFGYPSLAGFGFQMLIPCDADGSTPPPPGSPAYFMRHRDDEVHNAGSNNPTQDYAEIFEFDVDFATPGNSTFTGPISIPVAEFDSDLCGLVSFNCFPQQGSGTTLDPLREVIMWRLQYRNFTAYETLVGCYVVDVDGTDHGGIRWFELRKNASTAWTLYQEGTYAPDSDHRWMGSIAMDESGNIALGYNVSSSSTYPGIRYVGRLASDPQGTMPQGEFVIVGGSSPNGSNRYGDYSSMSVDPVDGCTFWFTGEYNPATTWSTRIADFVFDTCGCVHPDAPTGLTAVPNGLNRIDLSWNAVPGAESYNVYRMLGPCPHPGYHSLAPGVAGTNYSDVSVSGGSTYSYVVRAFDGDEICESPNSNCGDALALGSCVVPPTFAGAQAVESPNESACALRVTWLAAASSCGNPDSLVYNVYRATTSPFIPNTSNLVASCVAGGEYSDRSVQSGMQYHYIVRAEDVSGVGAGLCAGGIEEANMIERSGTPVGPETPIFDDDLEGGTANWTTAALPPDTPGSQPWTLVTTFSSSPTHAYFCSDEGFVKDQVLQTVGGIALSASPLIVLSFYHRVDTEANYDGGVLEYSTDGGANWFGILEGDGGTVPANSGRFSTGGYNSAISLFYESPIAGQAAWSGSMSGGSFFETRVDLSDMVGESLSLRWRMACDSSVSDVGWWVDDVRVFTGSSCDPGGYEAWRATLTWTIGTGLPDEDENGDGISNFESYFYGIDAVGTPTPAELDAVPRIVVNDTNLTYTFDRSTNDLNAAYFRLTRALDILLGPWSLVTPVPVPDPTGHVELEFPIPPLDGKLYLKLELQE